MWRNGTLLASPVVHGVTGHFSSCVWCLRVSPDDTRGDLEEAESWWEGRSRGPAHVRCEAGPLWAEAAGPGVGGEAKSETRTTAWLSDGGVLAGLWGELTSP